MHLVMLGLLCWLLKLFALNAIAWVGVAAVAGFCSSMSISSSRPRTYGA